MAFKCDQCGKEFNTEHALKIHVGRIHGSNAKVVTKAKVGRKGRRGGRPRKAAFTCEICGRPFALAMHLARHMTAGHKGAAGKAAVRGPAAAPAAGVDVAGLSVEQLLGLKQQIDGRLREILQQMKSAKLGL